MSQNPKPRLPLLGSKFIESATNKMALVNYRINDSSDDEDDQTGPQVDDEPTGMQITADLINNDERAEELNYHVQQKQPAQAEKAAAATLTTQDLLKLCGSQGRKLASRGVDLIEIDGSDLLNSAQLESAALKRLTTDSSSSYQRQQFKTTKREKAKHQITYLAEHARLYKREQDIRGFPRNTMISQKRYGFI